MNALKVPEGYETQNGRLISAAERLEGVQRFQLVATFHPDGSLTFVSCKAFDAFLDAVRRQHGKAVCDHIRTALPY